MKINRTTSGIALKKHEYTPVIQSFCCLSLRIFFDYTVVWLFLLIVDFKHLSIIYFSVQRVIQTKYKIENSRSMKNHLRVLCLKHVYTHSNGNDCVTRNFECVFEKHLEYNELKTWLVCNKIRQLRVYYK